MKYAIITLAGKQFKVSEGDKLVVNRLETEVGKKVNADSVIMVADGDNVMIGQPIVKDAVVSLEVLSQEQSPKIRVATYTAKARSRRVHGHRQQTSTVKVVSIS